MALLVLVSGLATLSILVVMLAFLVKQTIRLARAVQDLSTAVTPVLEEIQEEAERARTRVESITERQRQMADRRGTRSRRTR